jgi:hypothetical protein
MIIWLLLPKKSISFFLSFLTQGLATQPRVGCNSSSSLPSDYSQPKPYFLLVSTSIGENLKAILSNSRDKEYICCPPYFNGISSGGIKLFYVFL